jgi:hypothetical protein
MMMVRIDESWRRIPRKSDQHEAWIAGEINSIENRNRKTREMVSGFPTGRSQCNFRGERNGRTEIDTTFS